MGGGSGSRQYRELYWKMLLFYAASPLVLIVGIVAVFLPSLILLIALIAWGVVTARPSK